VEQVFLLLEWKEAWFLLLPTINWQSHGHVTWFDGIAYNLVVVVVWWNVTSWQRMEINDDWWCSKGASAWFLPPYFNKAVKWYCIRL